MLTDFVVRESIACAARSLTAGRQINVAINMTARAFDRLDLPERLESLCRDARLPCECVTLELTETQAASDPVRMMDVATRLRLKRFSLSVDDFGTGQSGLSLLQKVPFSELKIDRQFVDGGSTSASKRSVIEASLGLARNLKMVSVAEGIEKRADWELLRDLGCELMQGYFIARPMSEEGLAAWADSRTTAT
jgi:EAL domain-containing protein (putative c-di-GMP-specific phosphodiesterase class I)